MIREFWVENYLSIRDRQVLDFHARNPESALVSQVDEDVYLYKLAIFYGPNASGKSNILWAMNEVFRLLVMPKVTASEKVLGYFPFATDRDKPTKMGVCFYADGIRYDYEVAFNGQYILSEKLNYYPKGSKSLFYERRFVGDNVQADIKFGVSLHFQAKTQESVRENTLNNHSVLSVCMKNTFREDIEPFLRLHKWVLKHYHEVDGDYNCHDTVVDILKKAYSDDRRHRFFSHMLRQADLNIDAFRPVTEPREIPQAYRDHIQQEELADKVKEELLRPTVEGVVFESGFDAGTFDIPFKLQSKGTLTYIQILDKLYDMVSGKHVYLLDELGENLHYELMLYYISVFAHNSDQSQLLMTSQETALLSQDLISENRGATWFVEKNSKTASSEYSRGDSFGLHKNLSLYNSYRIGRMGAQPRIGSPILNLDD